MPRAEPRAEVIDVYRRIIGIIWQRLAPTFGSRTTAAIARNVIVARSRQYPALTALKVTEDGFTWDLLERRVADMPVRDIRRMLEDVLDDFFEALSSLIGDLLVSRIFRQARGEERKGGRK